MIVAVIGLPSKIQEIVERKLRERRPEFVFASISSKFGNGWKWLTESDEASNIASWLCSFLKGKNLQQRRSLLVVTFSHHLSSALSKELFPAISLLTLEQVDEMPIAGQALNEKINRLVAYLSDKVLASKIFLDALAHELHRGATSAILLPPANFSCAVLKDTLSELSLYRTSTKRFDPLEFDALRTHCRLSRADKKSYFFDQREVAFHAPGKYQHGERRPESGSHDMHVNRCWVSSHFRLGTRINPGFHYDCRSGRPDHEGDIRKKSFVGCHGQSANIPRATHANVYTNDFVR